MALEAAAVARVALHFEVGHEVHLDRHGAGAVAFFAAPAVDVEGEVAGLDAEAARLVALREEPADVVVDFQVRRGIGAQRARRQLLSHVDHLADQLEALDSIAGADVAHRLAAPAQIIVVEHVLDQRRLAGARNAGDANHPAERNPHVEAFEVVFARAHDPQCRVAFSETPLARQRTHQHHPPRRGRVLVPVAVGALDGFGAFGALVAAGARGRAGPNQVAAVAPAAGPEFHGEIGPRDHHRIMLDHDYGIAEVAQMTQHAEQAAHVARVQSDGGLVERIHRGGQQAAERAREMDTLGLAARKRARLALDRQVAESDFVEISDAALKLAQHDAGALGCARLAAKLLQPSLELAHREPSGLRNSDSFDAHVERLGLELGAAASGAGYEAAVACEEDPDVGLVAPLLHPAEKSAHPRPSLPVIAVRAVVAAVSRLAVE